MPTILFEATRLFMRAARTTPTGIDRVSHAYAHWLVGWTAADTIPVSSVGGVLTSLSGAAFRAMIGRSSSTSPSAARNARELSHALTAGSSQGLRLTGARTSIETRPARYARFAISLAANWRPRRPQGTALYLNVSHFGLEQPRLLERLADSGVKIVVLLHDLIPITHPEFCSPSAHGWHLQRVKAIVRHADLVVVNSETTGRELDAFARGLGRAPPKRRVAPLGLEPAFLSRTVDAAARPYFICVGTLEPRKNLTLLLLVWRRLAEQLGEATPPLVVAGQRGWECEAIVDQLERAPAVRRHVHEINGLSDEDLSRLIGGARALLSPSFIEGFNLPVAEALALGVPVIASDIPVHRELATGARLLDPLDGPAWLNAILSSLTQPPAAKVALRPWTWSDHFAVVEKVLQEEVAAASL